MRLFLALGLSMASGYLALSYEILWVRVFSFASAGRAWAFGVLLGGYLLGLALGSLAARSYCRSSQAPMPLRVFAITVLAGNLVAFLMVPLFARYVGWVGGGEALPLLTVAVPILGASFPLLCHFAVAPDAQAGSKLSYLFLANIVGSTAGSLVTGFVLMDAWPLQSTAVFLALAGLGMSAIAALFAQLPRRQLASFLGLTVAGAIGVVVLAPALFDRVYERLQLKTNAPVPFAQVVENRSGVITVTQDGTVYGGGVYDGAFNTSPRDPKNMIERAYSIGALHPSPRRILLVGLASGSWAQILANHPSLEQLTVVEINAGYIALLSKYSMVSGLLKNPKVKIVVDDGRRWLLQHDETFDLIVANATFHWRSHSTGLLSIEFLKLVQRHLKPGGIYYFNPTGSLSAVRTAAYVFSYAGYLGNSVAVSNSPMKVDRIRVEQLLNSYQLDGVAVIDPDQEDHDLLLTRLLNAAELNGSRESMLGAGGDATQLVTDDNMRTEWE